MAIGTLLRDRREHLGLSLRAVAAAVDVNPAHLSRVEKGTTPPSTQLLRRISSALDLPEEEVFLMAGRIPDTYRAVTEHSPGAAAAALGGLAGMLAASPMATYGAPSLVRPSLRVIEDGFPFEILSDVAEVESWRKEIYRPVYHQHKWWAQRLGSVFRAAILGAVLPKGSALMDLFYSPVKLAAPVIFDPFMGSGTTVGEAHKLGCTAIGRDINPVAYRNVRVALSRVDRQKLLRAFRDVEAAVGERLLDLYRSEDSSGRPCTVLYYFWVKQVPCPACEAQVDLFSKRIFARHAYAKKHPRVHVCCPGCGEVFASTYKATEATCPACSLSFDPQRGPTRGAKATCEDCGEEFAVAKRVRSLGSPPEHRLYAKLVLRDDGEKEYLRATENDLRRYAEVAARLKESGRRGPQVQIKDGYNTRQVLNYCYQTWEQMFNARQLYGLMELADAIGALPESPEKEALVLLFSGVLEFNNMFASYKGEGTGAVRHMFSHHVLKPERTPLEANIWGTPKSSGAFSTLFKSRLLRALDYKEAPFEVAVDRTGHRLKGRKVHGLSLPMGADLLSAYPDHGLPPGSVYLSCGDSAKTDLPDRIVDAVITDPPFFDNVHYSELADFFFSWQRLLFPDPAASSLATTRQAGEVQDTNSNRFASKLGDVFCECHRVLKDQGLLVFSYHHSRDDGWGSVAQAVAAAGFSVVQAQPVKAEMSVAAPKAQAKSPIDVDVMLVCRKATADDRTQLSVDAALVRAIDEARSKVKRFGRAGRRLSFNDVKVVVFSQLLVEVSAGRRGIEIVDAFSAALEQASDRINELWTNHIDALESPPSLGTLPQSRQALLFSQGG